MGNLFLTFFSIVNDFFDETTAFSVFLFVKCDVNVIDCIFVLDLVGFLTIVLMTENNFSVLFAVNHTFEFQMS